MSSIISKEDFDMTIEHQFFDVFYSIPTQFTSNEISEWCVVGMQLENSSDRRNFDYILYTHPISVYVLQVKKETLRSLLKSNYVSKSKKEIVEIKKSKIQEHYTKLLETL